MSDGTDMMHDSLFEWDDCDEENALSTIDPVNYLPELCRHLRRTRFNSQKS